MCNNCAFSLNERPNECMECEICIRNPKNASIKFNPTKYKDGEVRKPIDMYISKEFMAIIREEIRKTYEEGLKKGRLEIPHFPVDFDSRPFRKWFSSDLQQLFSSGDTLTISYSLSIPTCFPIEVDSISRAETVQPEDTSGRKKVIKTVCIDISEILQAMDGMEIGEAN